MNFRIADTLTASLARLTGEEQKAVKTTAFDLQMNPANPGLRFHKLDQAKDKRFASVRVNADIRLIVHRTESSLLLCYVDHHDAAYRWAERRRIERHPKTGAAQIVEVRETVRQIEVPVYVEPEPAAPEPTREEAPKPALFADYDDEQLLGYGVPADWLADVKAADEDGLLGLANHLPDEAAEALLQLAVGESPEPAPAAAADADPFAHPDAQRRFRLMVDSEELARALEAPWETWSVFLHPDQRAMVGRFSLRFVEREWTDVVDAWQLDSWEAYRDVQRLGRKTRLGEKQRATLWQVFERMRRELSEGGLVTMPMVFAAASERVSQPEHAPARFAVVDEAQDISVGHLRFLAAMAGDRANGLFFAGDLGQRIFQTPFSWRSGRRACTPGSFPVT